MNSNQIRRALKIGFNLVAYPTGFIVGYFEGFWREIIKTVKER